MEWQNRLTKLRLNPNELLPELVVTKLNSWKIIFVTGEDKKSYLQGQLTCDLVTLEPQESTLGAHCDAKGKVWSIFRCFNHKQGYALFHNASTIDNSLNEIKKYSVFSKVELTISSDIILGLLGEKADSVIDGLTSDKGDVRSFQGGTAVKIEDNRWILVLAEEYADKVVQSLDNVHYADEEIWDKADIENGLPRIIESIQNSQIPQAFNLQALDGISFSKGCYTGQETVARAKYRGTNKRFMAIVKGHVNTDPEAFNLERSVGENWRHVGSIFAHYRYNDGTIIGLVILPNNLEPDTTLRLVEQPNSIWQVEQLPYTIEE